MNPICYDTRLLLFIPIVCFFSILLTFTLRLFLARMTDMQALLFIQHSAGICQYQLDPLEFVKIKNIIVIS